MVDYAESVVAESTDINVKSRSISIDSISIPFYQIGLAVFISILIYMIGFQNNTISQNKHSINMKNSRLAELRLKIASLKAKNARILNSNYVVLNAKSKNLQVAESDNIQIIH